MSRGSNCLCPQPSFQGCLCREQSEVRDKALLWNQGQVSLLSSIIKITYPLGQIPRHCTSWKKHWGALISGLLYCNITHRLCSHGSLLVALGNQGLVNCHNGNCNCCNTVIFVSEPRLLCLLPVTMKLRWEFSDGPVLRAAKSLCSILGSGTKILQASGLGQNILT